MERAANGPAQGRQWRRKLIVKTPVDEVGVADCGPPRPGGCEAFWLAEQFIALGVHGRDISLVTGLPDDDIRMLLGRAGRSNPSGPPFRIERWLERSSGARRLQAAIFLDAVRRMGAAGQSPGRTVLAAYALYRELTPVVDELAFPVALALVRCCFGWWGQQSICQLERCGRCGTSYVRQITDLRDDARLCAFCRFQLRHRHLARRHRPRRLRTLHLPEAVLAWVQSTFSANIALFPP